MSQRTPQQIATYAYEDKSFDRDRRNWTRDADGNVKCIHGCDAGDHCPFGIARVLCYSEEQP